MIEVAHKNLSGSSQSSHHTAKFVDLVPFENEDKYFWFVTWPHDWTITWLCGWIFLILSHHPAKFGVHTLDERRNIMSFICQVTTMSKCHVTLWVGSPHPRPLGSIGLAKVEIKRFGFFTWPRDWRLTWFCRWGFLILSYHPAKLGVHRPCESGNITFLICHVTT